jgi:hypothetical protein
MSIEQAHLARARSYMLTAKAHAILRNEVGKGCRPEIATQPVALEPPYQPIFGVKNIDSDDYASRIILEVPVAEEQLVRLQLWLSPLQKCDWKRSELFIKQLSYARNRVALEIIGNQEQIVFQLVFNQSDLPIIQAAFSSQFEQCILSVVKNDLLRCFPLETWADAKFCDFYPPPPYSHLMTRPDELIRSPYATLMSVMAQIPDSALGFYQVVLAPVRPEHNWHQNVQTLLDYEYLIKLKSELSDAYRLAQQAPSGHLTQMANDVEVKSHSDKPFFVAALRIGVVDAGKQADLLLRSLAVVGSLIQHGGRPLNYLTEKDYRVHLSPNDIRQMFASSLTFRPGFLVNSWELTSLVHIPPLELIEFYQEVLTPLETLPPTESLSTGTPLGYCPYADTEKPVCIPEDLRTKHVHLIGRPGMGKSSTMEHMILHDVGRGHGVAVLDPHGMLVQRILCLMPEEHLERIIYIDPGDPDWVPIWNPFRCGPALNLSRIADDLVRSFKSFVTGWGDRLEHLLRHAIFALLHLPNSSLLDVSNILRQKSPESRELRSLVVKSVDAEISKLFWRHDFDRYRPADLAPPQHKLSKLLTSGTVSLMLSQGNTAFDFRDLMDSGKILLVDLSTVGPEVREILGCLMLSLLHLTALSRGSMSTDSHRPFHIYCDEAHRFLTDAVEDLIAETRKFNVSLTLAHQYMSQFNIRKTGALSSVGSTIIFNIDTKDAQHLKKDFQGLVELDDLIKLGVGEAVGRIANHVVRFKTHLPLKIPEKNYRETIIAQSHARYYKRTVEIQRDIRNRASMRQGPLSEYQPHKSSQSPLDMTGHQEGSSGPGSTGKISNGDDFYYEEF